MVPYHKIPTLWKRDPATKYKTLIENEWAHPAFGYMAGLDWDCYEKVDGTNIRVTYFPGLDVPVKFAGRTDRAQIPRHLMEELEVMFGTWFFTHFFDLEKSGDAPITLYGEGFGPKIQKGGGNYGARPDFCLFDIKIGDVWMEQAFASKLAEQAGLQRAPLVARGPLNVAIYKAQQGFNSTWGDFPAEGLIVRPPMELYDRFGKRIIGKIKTKDFPNG